MALTSGAKKFGITAIVAAAIIGGGFYFQKHKAQKPVVNIEVPVATVPASPVTPAEPTKEELNKRLTEVVHDIDRTEAKKKHVAKAAPKKHRPAAEPSHDRLEKELTSDQKALQGLAGDKL